MSTATIEKICERNLVGTYVDGELDANLTSLFEDHLESCADCRFELRAHRLFVCELDAALTSSGEIPVPRDFSRIIAMRATTDMRGVRTRSENR
jgi:anti-sigma factor RsiW